MRSKKLSRQIKKAFDSEMNEETISSLKAWVDAQAPCDDQSGVSSTLEALPSFFDQVDEAYQQLDEKAEMAQRSLEVSSKELTESNKALFSMNTTFDAMVNSLGQGFFLFGPDGNCLGLSSKVCETLLETVPAKKAVADVLRVAPDKRTTFVDWCAMLFEEVLEFDDLAAIGQKFFPHSGGRIVGLEYKPVRNKEGKIEAIVVIATDRTREIELDRKAQGMQAYATLVVAILKDRPRFRQFVMHSRRFFQEMNELLFMDVFTDNALSLIRRHLHTLKGAAGTFGMLKLKEKIHYVESDLSLQPGLAAAQRFLIKEVTSSQQMFDSLLLEHSELIGDLVEDTSPVREVRVESLQRFANKLKSAQGSKEYVYKSFIDEILCVPLWDVLKQFETVLQDTARVVHKKVDVIRFQGDKINILPEGYGEVWESLAHLFRNSVDHGIEHEAIRREQGKPEMGQITITTQRIQGERQLLEIRISDDGRGIDAEAVRAKLLEKGIAQAREMSAIQLIHQVFEPGVSTSKTVTEVSGRGVGLDVVRSAVISVGGSIRVESTKGKGTTFILTLPYLNEPFVGTPSAVA